MAEVKNVVESIYQKYGYDKVESTTSTTSTTSATSTTSTTGTTSTTDTTSTTQKTNTSLARYLDSTDSKDLNPKEIFKKLSIDVGSDGKTISKDQLDSYVKKAESGKIEISDEELSALQDMQDSWDKISQGNDSITYADMSQNKDILTSMAPEETETTDYEAAAKQATADAYAYIMQSALGTSSSSGSSSTANSLLNTLLTGNTDENDDANADLIDKLTNLIAEFKSSTKSTIETEA